MKRLPALLLLLLTITTHAQKYKDSLYTEYTEAYWTDRMEEFKYTNSLFHVAEQVFSVKHPAMRYAIKASGLDDSTALSRLGYETMGCFLDDKFLQWAGNHYEQEMYPILQAYGAEICEQTTRKMQSYGRIRPEDMARRMEQATQEGAVQAARNPEFVKKSAELRAEYGQDMILHSVTNTDQYLYVHCLYIRRYIMDACINHALAKYYEHRQAETARMLRELRARILPGTGMGNIDGYFKSKTDAAKVKDYLHRIAKAASESNADTATLKENVVMQGNNIAITYQYDNGNPVEQKTLGSLEGKLEWKIGQLYLSGIPNATKYKAN
ncbi:MAG: hypothetical protein JNL72_12335 [Flavipsychrobacter sp.]|nr:hypothetical protein [Flavipsychrobacter sp.]